jgi:hypothetical protein
VVGLTTSPRNNLTHKLQRKDKEYETVVDPEKDGKIKLEEPQQKLGPKTLEKNKRKKP